MFVLVVLCGFGLCLCCFGGVCGFGFVFVFVLVVFVSCVFLFFFLLSLGPQAAWQRQWPQQRRSRRQPWRWPVGVDAGRALQGLTAALDRDLAHTSALVTARMADMTVVLGNGDTLLELVTYPGHKHRARSQ